MNRHLEVITSSLRTLDETRNIQIAKQLIYTQCATSLSFILYKVNTTRHPGWNLQPLKDAKKQRCLGSGYSPPISSNSIKFLYTRRVDFPFIFCIMYMTTSS